MSLTQRYLPTSALPWVFVENAQQFFEVGVHRFRPRRAHVHQPPSAMPPRRSPPHPGAASTRCQTNGPSRKFARTVPSRIQVATFPKWCPPLYCTARMGRLPGGTPARSRARDMNRGQPSSDCGVLGCRPRALLLPGFNALQVLAMPNCVTAELGYLNVVLTDGVIQDPHSAVHRT